MSEELNGANAIITKFLLNTTQLINLITRQTQRTPVAWATTHPLDDKEANVIPLTTGSVAEFCIEPMLRCFGDIDIMFHRDTELAIPRRHSSPTQLGLHQMSFTTMSRYSKLSTVTFLAICTYWHNTVTTTHTTPLNTTETCIWQSLRVNRVAYIVIGYCYDGKGLTN